MDWLSIARLNEYVPLNIDCYPTGERSPVWDAITIHLTAGGHRVLSLVAEDNGHIVALGQAMPRDFSWHVARLMTNGRLSDSEQLAILSQLLSRLAEAVAAHGAVRLHARIERDAVAIVAFTQAGFSRYAHESVYWLPPATHVKAPIADLPLRPQECADTWAIHQLYCTVTPWVVQQAEGFDASAWEIPSAGTMRALQTVGEHRWVLDSGGEILGYMRTNRLTRRLHLLVHPQAYQYAEGMIAFGVADLSLDGNIRCSIPEYQSELGKSLVAAGFQFIGTQTVLCKQLAIHERVTNRVLRPVFEHKLDPARSITHHICDTPAAHMPPEYQVKETWLT